ncbi:MAG: peroxiredoxin [Pseudomonadota bacterium]
MNLTQLPDDLPVPQDDGATDHLLGMLFPRMTFLTTEGEQVSPSSLPGYVVLYIYPMTGRPGVPLPDGWDEIPGARGCTPQSCSFRDHYRELQSLQTYVFGLSTQTSDYQAEARDRLHLPFELLSDTELKLKQTLKLPTFFADNRELYKRATLILRDGIVVKVFYPIFPPGENAESVLSWLQEQPRL